MPDEQQDEPWVLQVLTFWFEELQAKDWFVKDESVDRAITERFAALYDTLQRAPRKKLRSSKTKLLASVIVLDQFPRNMFRNSPRAYESDAAALELAQEAIDQGADRGLSARERQFLYMPFQHSEERHVQARSVALFAQLELDNALEFAQRHKQIIDRFGRFPHRNEALGRRSSPEELAFLQEPNSSF